MSFRGDDQGRYGHIPPVQYPIANQQHQQQHPQQHQQYQQHQQHQQHQQQAYGTPLPQQPAYEQNHYPVRRPSFNSGDDTSYFDQGHRTQPAAPPHHHQQPHRGHGTVSSRGGDDELFLTSPGDGPSPAASAPPLPAKVSSYGGSAAGSSAAMAGYQHQYQAQASPTTSYNPQAFARSQSHSLPYHPYPTGRLASPTMPSFPSPQQQQQPFGHGQNYTPAAYNPAAYATAQPPVPQRTATHAGYTSYQQTHSYSAPVIPTAATSPALYSPPAPSQPSPGGHSSASSYQPGSYYGSAASASGVASPPPSAYDQYDQAQPPPPPPPSQQQQQQQQYLSSYSPNSTGSNSYFTSTANGVAPTPTPGAIASTMTSQAPYPSGSHMPTGGGTYSSGIDPSAMPTRASRSNSNVSAAAAPLAMMHSHSPSPASGIQRHPTNAPLPHRPPMDDLREDAAWGAQPPIDETPTASDSDDYETQNSLMHDIEADLGISLNGGSHAAQNGMAATPDPRSAGWGSSASSVGRTTSSASVFSSASQSLAAATPSASYKLEDDSDPEGTFGVYEMRRDDLNAHRYSTSVTSFTSSMSGHTANQNDYGQPVQHALPPQPLPHDPAAHSRGQAAAPAPLPRLPGDPSDSDSDVVGIDIGLFSGGAYLGQIGSSLSGPPELPPQSITPRPYETGSNNNNNNNAPYPRAEVDYGDTGGLQPPAMHRLSFDEGDEHVSVHSGSESPSKEEYSGLFYHPGPSNYLSNRPLPATPSGLANGSSLASPTGSTGLNQPYRQHVPTQSTEFRTSAYLTMKEEQQQQLMQHQPYQNQPYVERSTSMMDRSTTPAVHVPGRSRTDAAEERRKAHRQLVSQGPPTDAGYDGPGAPASLAYDVITLPTGRRKKFAPSKLTAHDFRRCQEPWALSNIAHWVREMADGEPDLKRKSIEEGLVSLFTAKVPNMNVADAETLAASVVDSMFAAGILIPEEEWVKFGPGEISGVLWQLTGAGCYAQRLHDVDMPGRCYSYYCTRTLKKANLDGIMSEESTKKEDWVTFYKITKEMMESKHRKEIERQNVLHEIVTSEEEYNSQLDVLRVLYKEQLRHWEPAIIPANRLDKFIKTVFGKVDSMQRVNKDHLLAQLKYRQNEQGPWITGFSDIFREWIRKAKDEYIAYSTAYPVASYTVRREAARNMLFQQFLDHVRNHQRSNRLGWDTFLKAPITRLQRYSLLLSVVLKNTLQDNEEKTNLARAIEEIRMVTKDCDRLVDEMGKKVSLQELQSQLMFRPGSQTVLNLDHLGRELLMQGDLQRMGTKGVRWVDTHALLFDHYFLLTKAVSTKDGRSDKKYDVSKEPIPMPLLLLESMHDDPITKQKGLAAPLTRTAVAAATTSVSDTRLASLASRPDLEHTSTSGSLGLGGEEGKTLYPFRVKHLGHEVYTLYATSPQMREDWCSKIIEAKTRHARALLEQNAEPFRLRVLADTAFAYDSSVAMTKQTGVPIQGTPLDRSIREIEDVLGAGRGGPGPVCRATVNCSAGFTAFGKSVVAIGTDFGVYISDATNPRGWTRSVQINKVTQIAVLEAFSVCLVLADKALISYPLEVIAPVSNFAAPASESPRHAPQRLAKDVSFFAVARMKDRTLLFYKRKEGMHNKFKVLEPVFQKASEKKPRFFGSRRGGTSGTTETFRDFDEFYLPIECYSLNLFQTYVAVSTAKGIELLTLDRKQTMSVPQGLALPATQNIAARIRDQRPLGMFRLNDQEFLLAYEDCAVYADKHGEVSRTLIMEYSGKQKKARAATMFGQYLILFNEDYVEVRNAENGRLRQIIAGNDVRCLDFGFRGPTGGDNASATAASSSLGTPTSPQAGQQPFGQDSKGTVKISMTHPEAAGVQLVVELQLNDGHAEKA